MEMSHWENWITEEQYVFIDDICNIMYFSNQLHTQFHILCLKPTEEACSEIIPGYIHYQYIYTY